LFFETIERYLQQYAILNAGKRHVRNLQTEFRLIRGFFVDRPLDSFRRKDIEDFKVWRLGQRVSRITVNRGVVALSGLFRWAIDREEYPRANPCSRQKLKVNDVREVDLPPESIRVILARVEAHGNDRFTLAVHLALFTGMRQGEICAITWTHVDMEEHIITLPPTMTKNGKRRVVAMPRILLDRLSRCTIREGNLVGLRKDQITHLWVRFADALPYRTPTGRLRFHDLRHIHAGMLRRAGVGLDLICEQLGHHSPAFTRARYAQVAHGLPEGVDKLTDLMGNIHG